MTSRGALILLALLVGGGCGNKTAVRPPELIQPMPATQLAARPTRDGVVLTWRRPVAYSGGGRMNDLGGFEIDRAPIEAPGGFTRIATLELTDQTRFRPERDMTWTDTTAAPGTRYLYRVVGFTLDGYRSAPAVLSFDPSAVRPAAPAE